MPHIIVKMYPGRNDEQKAALCKEIQKATIGSLGVPEKAVSVSVIEIPKEEWQEKVVGPDILANPEIVYINPNK